MYKYKKVDGESRPPIMMVNASTKLEKKMNNLTYDNLTVAFLLVAPQLAGGIGLLCNLSGNTCISLMFGTLCVGVIMMLFVDNT